MHDFCSGTYTLLKEHGIGMSMKKFLTAILLFDLMAGLLFLGLWERESSAVTAWGNNSGISEEEGERGRRRGERKGTKKREEELGGGGEKEKRG